MNDKSVSIIGGGWRTECWIEVIKKLKNITLKDVFCRNDERAKGILNRHNVVTKSNYKDIFKDKPDVVIVCTAKKDNFNLSFELIKNGLDVLCETPLEIPENYYSLIDNNGYGKLRVAEQYRYQPRFQVAKSIIESGILGKVHTVELSCCHDYHAMSLARFLLNINDVMPDDVHSFYLGDKYVNTHFRYGEIEHNLSENNRTISIMKFGDKKVIYDFADGMYFSSIRRQHFSIKGENGEYYDGKGCYLDKNGKTAIINCEDKFSGTQGDLFNLDYIGTYFNGKEIYHNKYYGLSMSGEQISMAENLEKMFEFLETGKEFYTLKSSDIDAKIADLMRKNVIKL